MNETTPKIQNASVTNDKLANGIDGAKILNGSITSDKLVGEISGGDLNEVPLSKLPDAPHNTVLAGPTSSGTAEPAYRQLIGPDLPAASNSEKGAVSVPPTGGLSVDVSGAIGITNATSAKTASVVTYNQHGLIQSGRSLEAADMPPAAPGQLGAVKPGDGITISNQGTIAQSVTGVIAGTYPKVVVDARGNVTEGKQLEASDIPDLNFSQITGDLNFSTISGLVVESQLADKSVTRRKIANYAISFVQETVPASDSSTHIGCMWFQESTASLNMWNGNSWMSVGQGRLSAENLRYCGIVDASTGLITGLTQFGSSAGLEIGSAIPVASDALTGVYFVVEVGGDQIAQTPGTTYNAGDWCLCSGAAAGWSRINIASGGGGGGGGVSRLSELLDVDVSSAVEGSLLQLQANGIWQNVQVLDGGTF